MKYFLHDTSAFDDEKVTELYLQFGYEGLGLFYTCLEKIGKQEKPVKTEVLKAQLRVGKRLEKCWSFMEEIGLISSNNGETFNKQLLNFSEKYQIKKEKTREKVSEWRKKQQDAENVTGYVPVSNPPKVKESKVKESKVKEEIQPDKPVNYLDKIICQFSQSYFKAFGIEYAVTKGKDRAAACRMAERYKEKYPEGSTEDALKTIREWFDMVMFIDMPYLQDNMTLPIVMSKFNEINKHFKNGNYKRNHTKASDGSNVRDVITALGEKFNIPAGK